MATSRRVCVTMVTVHVLALLVCVQWVTVAAKDCLLKDQCSCHFDDGSGTVDLTSLGNSDNTPRFKDVYLDSETTYYSYNPCGPFTEGACAGAAACTLNEDKTQQTQIGNTSSTAFKYDSDADQVIVGYTASSGVLVLTEVDLICDKSACDPVFVPVGRNVDTYTLQLTSICACPDMCTASGPSSCGSGSGSGIGAGSVLLIIFFTVLFVYIVAGALFMKFVRKSSGTELIPNRDLWTSIPGLIKDGFRCTFGICLRKQMTYDQV